MKEAGRAALIIGVNDYRALDPSGSTDLRGACNDAKVWAVAARSLGIEQIRILTSPPLSADDLSIDAAGITFGEATAAEIRDGVRWLAGEIGGAGAGQGMVAYSGHGSTEGEGLVLCPSDLSADFSEAIAYADIAAALESHAPQTNVTFFLDTCHAARPRTLSDFLRSLGRRSLVRVGAPAAALSRALRPGDMVVAACRPDQSSQESFLHDRVHGAFTWAASAAISRSGLGTDPETGRSFFRITYRQLRAQTAGLVSSLNFHQQPALEGPRALLDLPVLHPRTLKPVAVGSDDGDDGGKQILPEEHEAGTPMGYATFKVSTHDGSQVLGHMLTNGATALNNFKGYDWAANTEYWMWGSSGTGTTWPLQSFMLELVSPDSIPQSSYSSQTPFKFENKPFPPASQGTNRTVNVNNGKWWSISFAANDSPQIGWLKTRASASPPHNNWYEYTDVSWGTMNGDPIDPQIWLTITQPGTTAPGMENYPNHVLYFTYAAAGLNSTTDTHPGDQSEPNNQYKLVSTVKLKSNQV